MDKMHDWTLLDVKFDWRSACASLTFEDCEAKSRTLTAEKVRLLEIPREDEWGPSVSVNETADGPGPDGVGQMVRIEMQSGDAIRLWAARVSLT